MKSKTPQIKSEPWHSNVLAQVWNELSRTIAGLGVYSTPGDMLKMEPVDNQNFTLLSNVGLGTIRMFFNFTMVRNVLSRPADKDKFFHDVAVEIMAQSIVIQQKKLSLDKQGKVNWDK